MNGKTYFSFRIMMVFMVLIMVVAFSIAIIYRDVPHMQEFSFLSVGVMIIFMAIIALIMTRISHTHKMQKNNAIFSFLLRDI